ncbi:hypothetical protein OJ253_3398 [Cryptosporidium canis]|uniref:Uncharacterized protein n=1 Tax=Cryptosporidium canis TaxID=195482 RepID=A0A9D5HUN6_9CRYT|nr:hypothetical protein OJ253_3398 [Cryptosporidium canis]
MGNAASWVYIDQLSVDLGEIEFVGFGVQLGNILPEALGETLIEWCPLAWRTGLVGGRGEEGAALDGFEVEEFGGDIYELFSDGLGPQQTGVGDPDGVAEADLLMSGGVWGFVLANKGVPGVEGLNESHVVSKFAAVVQEALSREHGNESDGLAGAAELDAVVDELSEERRDWHHGKLDAEVGHSAKLVQGLESVEEFESGEDGLLGRVAEEGEVEDLFDGGLLLFRVPEVVKDVDQLQQGLGQTGSQDLRGLGGQQARVGLLCVHSVDLSGPDSPGPAGSLNGGGLGDLFHDEGVNAGVALEELDLLHSRVNNIDNVWKRNGGRQRRGSVALEASRRTGTSGRVWFSGRWRTFSSPSRS